MLLQKSFIYISSKLLNKNDIRFFIQSKCLKKGPSLITIE